jgi:hypothetical protein
MKITSFEGIIENGQIRLPAISTFLKERRYTSSYPTSKRREHLSSIVLGLRIPNKRMKFKKEVFEETGDASL